MPEEFYVRSFIRKYAAFLGVAPEPLVEEYRRQRGTEGGHGEAPTSPFARTTSRKAEALRRRRKRQAFYTWAGLGLIVAVVIVAILLLIGGGGEGGSNEAKNVAGNGNGTGGGAGAKGGGKAGANAGQGGAAKGAGGKGGGHAGEGAAGGTFKSAKDVKLEIEPTAEVWACVLNANGKPLVDGATLAAGEAVGPFESRSYTAAFGNGAVAVAIDGKPVATPETPSPMGFTVDGHGKVHDLPEGERPSCE